MIGEYKNEGKDINKSAKKGRRKKKLYFDSEK